MTNEEAIKNLAIVKNLEDALGNFDGGVKNSDLSKSLAMAIKALGHQPCDDCISRQDAIDAVRKAYENDEMLDGYEYRLGELPSVQPDHTADINKKISISYGHENDLISRQAAIEAVNQYNFDFPQYMERFVTELRDAMKADLKHDIEALPSAQPEIIRCRECKYAEVADKEDTQDGYICQFHRGSIWFSGSYCSWAERRTDE